MLLGVCRAEHLVPEQPDHMPLYVSDNVEVHVLKPGQAFSAHKQPFTGSKDPTKQVYMASTSAFRSIATKATP